MLDKNNPTSLVPDLWPTIEKLILNFDQFDSSRNHFLRTKRVGVSSLANFWCLSSDFIHRVGKISQIFKDKSELNGNLRFVNFLFLMLTWLVIFFNIWKRISADMCFHTGQQWHINDGASESNDIGYLKSFPWSKLKTFLEDEHNTANYYSASWMGESSHRVCESLICWH